MNGVVINCDGLGGATRLDSEVVVGGRFIITQSSSICSNVPKFDPMIKFNPLALQTHANKYKMMP